MNFGDNFHVVYNEEDALELISTLGDPISYRKAATFFETGVMPPADVSPAAMPPVNKTKYFVLHCFDKVMKFALRKMKCQPNQMNLVFGLQS